MAPAEGGMEASRRMHEYLLSKQRKQEEYWLRKYGKVLQAPPPSVGKPAANPRLPPIAGGSASSGSQSSTRGSNTVLTGDPSGGLLPPLHGVQGPPGPSLAGLSSHHHRQPKGHAPIFHANEPVKDFFSRNARQSRTNGGVVTARDEYGNLLSPSHRPAEPYRGRGLPSQLPPMSGYGQQHQLQQGPDDTEIQAAQQQQQQEYKADPPSPQQSQQYGGYPQAQHNQHPQHPQQFQHPQASPRGGYIPPPRVGVPQPRTLPPLAGEASSSRSPAGSVTSGAGPKPLRSLEMELTVIRAIKAREDVLERLRIASGKLDSGFGGSVPVVLSPVDPLVRLFYRLVGTLRQRTLDVIEAIAAWRRKVNPTDPFIYYGVDYLAVIGPDLGFLDELPFMRSRLTFTRAADDPFLAEVTPDGIPIEEATTCDLRRGGQRFSSEALRIRMARKVLAHYCGRALPGEVSGLTLDGGLSAMSAGGLHSESSQPRLPRSTLPTVQDAEEDGEGGGMTTQQIIRALSPPVPPVTASQPPAPRAITPPAADSAVEAEDAAAVMQHLEEEEERAGRNQDDREAAVQRQVAMEAAAEAEAVEAAVAAQEALEAQKAAEAEDVQAVGDQDAFNGALRHQQQLQQLSEEEAESPVEATVAASVEMDEQMVPDPQQQPQQQPQIEDLLVFEDDNDFIDFALGALLHSLEPPYVHTIPPGSFTVAGWEIDRQLDEVVRGIASPDRFSHTGIRTESAMSAAATASPLRRSSVVAASPPPAAAPASLGSSGRIPRPPSEPKPPSRGQVLDVKGVKPPSRGSRIPTGPSVTRPPVRVHLNARDSGLDMALSMDEEGPLTQVNLTSSMGQSTSRNGGEPVVPTPGPAAVRPLVRVHLNARNSGLDMALSMDAEEFAEQGSVASSTGRTTGSGSIGSSSSNSSIVKPTGSVAHIDGCLPSILEDDQGAFSGGMAGGGQEDCEDGATALLPSRPRVRVHLRPNSREINMALSMDDDGMLMASPEVAEAAVPRLDDMPAPLQGPLSARSNRASLRLSRQSGSRPGSTASTSEGVAGGELQE